MDCNREEAIRAKAIAEKKMESKDFVGARKIALKAKQLYPDVENICQLLLVCDVHCSATKDLLGGDMDWYKILQVDKTADDAAIKKQYRKFALLLHPDKNKFSGAEGAFKLIGEAQRILLDKEKRRYHDIKNGVAASRPRQYTTVVPNANRSTPPGRSFYTPQSQQPSHPEDTSPAFWTMCPFCAVRYQYFKDIMNRSIRCQRCAQPFVAYDLHAVPATNFTKPTFPQQQMNNTRKMEADFQKNSRTGNLRADSVQNTGKQANNTTPTASARKVNRKNEKKRARHQSELSESELSDSGSDSEEEMEVDDNDGIEGGQNSGYREENVRRSSRRKKQVSYKEHFNDVDDDADDGFDQGWERAKGKRSSGSSKEGNRGECKEESGRSDFGAETGNDCEDRKEKVSDGEECLPNGDKAQKMEGLKDPVEEHVSKNSFQVHDDVDSSSEEEVSDSLLNYPDPDFSNFDEARKAEHFMVGQVWAAYDEHDAMPRYYAKIRKVFSPGFKLQIYWLDPDPSSENEKKWHSKDLPISCGRFKYGNSEIVDNQPMFSHVMTWAQGNGRDTIVIYPRKGEIWAIFKNWDIKWSCDPDSRRKSKYEYDFVVVLGNYVPDVGIHVGYLTKVKGFVSIFRQRDTVGKNTFILRPNEFLRFSHMIPNHKMKGDEGEGVPKDSFELDTASLPFELDRPPSSKHKAKDGNTNSSRLQPETIPSDSNTEALEVPEPEFFDFDAEKSEGKFQVGQIWALFSDEDELPKYYCRVNRVNVSPVFNVHISWLSPLPSETSVGWLDDKMPRGCGTFELLQEDSQIYRSRKSFSHQVEVETSPEKKSYEIVPSKGKVWAMYRNWRADMKLSDLKNCEYDVVEIIGNNHLQIEVLFLDRVPKFNSVFKPREQQGSAIAKTTISRLELLKFSHQIPAFRLTEEKGGALRGFWEVDPAALPVHYFSWN